MKDMIQSFFLNIVSHIENRTFTEGGNLVFSGGKGPELISLKPLGYVILPQGHHNL